MKYTAGMKIEQKVNDNKTESFILLERTDTTYPTNGEWALVRWRVAFEDHYGNVDMKAESYRAIVEVGTPNTHKPFTIEVPDTRSEQEKAINNIGLSTKEVKKAVKKIVKQGHRGRPSVGMNELKAKNQIRDFKQGKRTADEVSEAFNFLMELKQEKYLEKHFLPFV